MISKLRVMARTLERYYEQIIYRVTNARLSPTEQAIYRVRQEYLTYLERKALRDLAMRVFEVDSKRIPGIIVEAGCALGGSAIVIAATKSPERELHVYDVFGMIPAPSEKDEEDVHRRYEAIVTGQARGIGKEEVYYGYKSDLRAEVVKNFERLGFSLAKNNITLIQGLFQETMPESKACVALAHIDGDWYESVYTCLDQLAPKVVIGGWIIVDDYESWSGCRKAVDDYFSTRADSFRFERLSRLHIFRIKEDQ